MKKEKQEKKKWPFIQKVELVFFIVVFTSPIWFLAYLFIKGAMMNR